MVANILIVEDEPLIAMMLEDFCESLGHRVAGSSDNVADALAAIDQGGVDIAILDLHLVENESAWPVADRLADAGVAFVLASGGQLEPPPDRHRARPWLIKPFTMDGVREALDRARAEVAE